MSWNEIITIAKKELFKSFGNKRILFTTAIMPGLVIFVLYSLMGKTMANQQNIEDLNSSYIITINLPEEIKKYFEASNLEFQNVGYTRQDEMKELIKNKTEVLLVLFPDEFSVTGQDSSDLNSIQNIEVYYNSSSKLSSYMYSKVTTLINEYESSIFNLFDINNSNEQYDLASNKESVGRNLSAILPMLLMGLIYSCCLSIAAESIAGEKERGTMATLLVTPVSRVNIAMAKVTSLSIVALISGISSYIGIVLSLPSLLNLESLNILMIYNIEEYILLFFTVFSIILVIISIMSIVSAYSNTIKEATTSLSPFAALMMLIGLTCMIQTKPASHWWMYLIPLYNGVQELYGILISEINYINFTVMFVSNSVYVFICIFILSRMFNNEKIIFG
ncbi:sodium transport system permease protein [Lachnotalea glycerini]|uniref:Sodium transport system permease protein n=1 Tax=Lachnotalea glycerini TaxID=1763509 RepID=A0A318EUJ3_9FIRM|nr:ABC transporter permease [Lachnotalea glycerini]PXV91870.1 sodium transport system permease protein [Lachnotalea glycerini]